MASIRVLENIAGKDNVRVEHSAIYLFSKKHNAFLFFCTKLALKSYAYHQENGWYELENDVLNH